MCAILLWSGMSERFIKFIPSPEAMYLVRKHINAFALLTFIAERARRENGLPDGLTIGQCHLGDYKSYGLTEKEYRNAKKVLVERGHIKIIETCRTRKSKKFSKSTLVLKNDEKTATERATRSTTIGTLVEICSTMVYDINSDDGNQQKGDRKGERGATEGRPKGDEQEGIRKKKKEKEDHPSIPSGFRDMGMIDDFSSKIKIYDGNSERGIEPVFFTQEELDMSIKIKGSLEEVKKSVEFIQTSSKRKHPILNWVNALSKWKIPDKNKLNIEDNLRYAEKLFSQFSEFINGWRCENHKDKVRDISGILFIPSSPYLETFFVAYSDGDFKNKCYDFLRKKMEIYA